MATKLIDKESALTTPSTLDLFSTLPTLVGEKCSRLREVNLQSSLLQNGPFEFVVNSAHMIDLSRTYFTFKFRVFVNGTPYPATRPNPDAKKDPLPTPLVAPVNGVGEYFLSQVVLSINGQEIENSGPLHFWRAFCETELTLDSETKKCTLGALAVFSIEDDHTLAVTNKGYVDRSAATNDGKTYQCFARIHLGLCNQNKLIPPNTPLKFVFHRNSDAFCMLNFNKKMLGTPDDAPHLEPQLFLDHVALLVREVEIEQSLALDIERLLASGQKIRYNIKSVQLRNHFIAPGRREETNIILSQGQPLPRRIIIAFVDPNSFHGSYSTDPLKFLHGNLVDLHIEAGSRTWPLKGWSLNFDKNDYGMAYLHFLEGLGFSSTGRNCGVTYEQFKAFRAIYVVDLAPDVEADCFTLEEIGTVTLRLNFQKTVEEPGLMLLAYLEGNQILNLDRGRNVTLSNSPA